MPDVSAVPTLAAVVVHHRSLGTVGDTVGDLVAAGIPPQHLLVVDNSEDEDTYARLEAVVGDRARCLTTGNRGYGAAVNMAVSQLNGSAECVLVVTHEVRLASDCVEALVSALKASEQRAVAAPLLLVLGTSRLWSAGGTMTGWLRIPAHLLVTPTDTGWAPTDWVDGACCLYRADVLRQNPFREDFFMYYEETDLHVRLRGLGWDVGVVPHAIAFQAPGRMTPFQRVRGLVLLQAGREPRFTRVAAAVYALSTAAVLSLLQGRPAGVVEGYRGLRAGVRETKAARHSL